MNRRTIPSAVIALAAVSACHTAPPAPPAAATIRWESFAPDLFERARAEQRFVLLDLEAVWCHWCHVMDETTYRDPAVVRAVGEHYIAVRVDQDSRPDLANRYEDYGWPATIVFAPDGSELAKRSGYIPPEPMVALLDAIVADPTPGPSVLAERRAHLARLESSATAAHSTDLLRELEADQVASYDAEHEGFGFGHKYVDAPSVEHAITRGLDGDGASERRARATLDANLALIDRAWGGVYQYSAGGGWNEPHFEKILSMQADNLRMYSLAWTVWRDPEHLEAARAIRRYLRDFLASPDGAFYTSQDADLVPGEHAGSYFALSDAERRARGIPRIDRHVYARENGWAIRALCAYAAASGDDGALADAVRAAEWIVAHRSLAAEGGRGGFSHDAEDAGGPYLADNLAMGQALLALYETTADRAWLARCEQTMDYIARTFARAPSSPAATSERSDASGFATVAATAPTGGLAPQPPLRSENVELARLANALARYSGNAKHRAIAEHALQFVSIPEVARRRFTAGVLLAAHELASDPVHVTVVGAKSDAQARALWRAALAYPAPYRQIEWWDPAEPELRSAEFPLPTLDRAAAFACASGRCSSPAYEPSELADRVASLQ